MQRATDAILHEKGQLRIAWNNPAPVRLATRAALRVAVPADAVDWRAVRKAADDSCRRAAVYLAERQRNVG
jgi:hypothetical protein